MKNHNPVIRMARRDVITQGVALGRKGRIICCATFCLLLIASVAFAQQSDDELTKLRRATVESTARRELSPALAPRTSWSWQPIAPKSFNRSLAPPSQAPSGLAPRLAKAERGYVERFRPATEQLALGLSADPPRPNQPQFIAGARSYNPSPSAVTVLQIPNLGKSSEAKLSLDTDPATIATKPYTAGVATATRGAAPPREGIGVPDPFLAEREVRLAKTPTDDDPPAISLGTPERPLLPVSPPPLPPK
jgi:hypothetical protein